MRWTGDFPTFSLNAGKRFCLGWGRYSAPYPLGLSTCNHLTSRVAVQTTRLVRVNCIAWVRFALRRRNAVSPSIGNLQFTYRIHAWDPTASHSEPRRILQSSESAGAVKDPTMDSRSVYSAHVFEPSYAENGDTRLQLLQQLETFILDFRLDNNFVYRYVARMRKPSQIGPNMCN